MKTFQRTLAKSNCPTTGRTWRAVRHFAILFLALYGAVQESHAQACTAADYNIVTNKQMISMSTTMTIGGGSFAAATDGVGGSQQAIWWQRNINVVGQEVLKMVFPAPAVLIGFETTGSFFLDNGVTYRIEGSNNGSTWTDLTGAQTFSTTTTAPAYGAGENSYKFPIANNTTAYTQYRLYGLTGQTDWNWVSEIYLGVIPTEQSGISNIACNANGTLFDGADDYVTFDLNPTGGTGTYTVSVSGTTVTPGTGTFGVPASFSLGAGSVGGGDLSLTISGFTAGCQLTENITDPGSCTAGECGGTDWNLPASKITITASVTVSNSPSPSNPNNVLDSDINTKHTYKSNVVANLDIMKFTFPEAVKLYGFELETTQAIFNNNTTMKVQASEDDINYVDLTATLNYPNDIFFVASLYGATNTVYRFTFPSNDTKYQYYRLRGVSGSTIFSHGISEAYFSYDNFNAGLSNIGCNDNGTPTNFSDDRVTFDLNPSPGTGAYSVTVDGGFSVTPATGTYGVTTSFTVSSGSSGSGDLTVHVIDASVPCIQDVIVANAQNTCLDTDLDGVQDINDLDDDNDGILDAVENAGIDFNVPANKQAITITAGFTGGTQAGNPAVLLDGNTTAQNFWFLDQNIAGDELLRLQFPKPTVLEGFEILTSGFCFKTGAVVNVEVSNDGSSWSVLQSFTRTGAGTPGQYGSGATGNVVEVFNLSSNTTAYKYYRLLGVSGNAEDFNWVYELFFQTSSSIDGDGDGLINSLDLDSDNDGIPDNVEAQPTLTYIPPAADNAATYAGNLGVNSAYPGGLTPLDTDGDLCADFVDDDSENDGIPDRDETGLSLLNVVGNNGLDNGVETADTYADVNGNIDDPDTDLAGNGAGQEVDYRRQNINVTVTANQAACANPSDNPLTSIVVTGQTGAITKAGYSMGTVYFGPDFSTATAVTNLPGGFAVVSGLPNPDFTTYYTVRAYLDAVSYEDYVVSIDRKVCSVADLSLQVDPSAGSANAGEDLVYTVTLTNNGPDPALNVKVKVDIPVGMSVVTASPSLGEYSPGSQLWTMDQVPLGAQTLTITYRMQ